MEKIQDEVEKVLMAHGFFAEAKNYILYRWTRTEKRRSLSSILRHFGDGDDAPDGGQGHLCGRLSGVLRKIQEDYTAEEYDLSRLSDKFSGFCKPDMTFQDRLEALIKAAVELTAQDAPHWEYIAGRLLSFSLDLRLEEVAESAGLHSFYDKVRYLTDEGLYGSYILENYTRAEICEAGTFIRPERNLIYSWSGLDLLIKRYIIRTHAHRPVESVQEMFLGIALHLAMPEKTGRMLWVRKFYDMLSQLQVTMATPTLSNARKPYHQLSSCFIDTVPDSLEGIYRSIDNFAKVSKFGGGMGLYFGKVRATGGNIRGFKGVAGGVIRWIRLVNDTAVAVDQLGMRQGAVAVYLDVWHKDLPEFLQLRTNNGDDRMKAHDVFPAVCYPDLFWKMASEDLDQPWHLFCPNEIMTVKGYCLEDYYGEEWERRYKDCVNDSRISRRTMTVKDIVRLVLKSAVETGTPFTFNRDIVNRANPDSHAVFAVPVPYVARPPGEFPRYEPESFPGLYPVVVCEYPFFLSCHHNGVFIAAGTYGLTCDVDKVGNRGLAVPDRVCKVHEIGRDVVFSYLSDLYGDVGAGIFAIVCQDSFFSSRAVGRPIGLIGGSEDYRSLFQGSLP